MLVFGPLARALGAGLDGLTRLTARMNERFDAHWTERTKLLRAHYDRRMDRSSEPLAVLDGPIDLALRDDLRKAA